MGKPRVAEVAIAFLIFSPHFSIKGIVITPPPAPTRLETTPTTTQTELETIFIGKLYVLNCFFSKIKV